MEELNTALEALRFGGAMVYPLLILGVLAAGIILDRVALYSRCLRLPEALRNQVETYGFGWDDLEKEIGLLGPRNAFGRFFQVIAANRTHPAWWVESRAGDEAGEIERALGRGLWVLETIVTAAPLMGLLGTITGMMQSFKVIGGAGLVAPTQVTAGVAQALIATALGLLIALVALFAFNFFSRMKSRGLDEMERLGSRLVDRIRLDQETATTAVPDQPRERRIVGVS
ncbi:MAG TPA: MotA/TolQ/ExbB proton channel family protein [Candidatus Binatia bacterium]|nr:MotA/TolQ/ExbB proton channel family protein [Candidatus Binatia bacterium]